MGELLSGSPNVLIQSPICITPAMVPVSYPNSIPPKAAKAVIIIPDIPRLEDPPTAPSLYMLGLLAIEREDGLVTR